MKRWLLKLALFLVLGAIVNVAVAWGCGWFITLDWRQQNGTRFDHFTNWFEPGRPFPGYTANRWTRTGAMRISLYRSGAFSGMPGQTTCAFEDMMPIWARPFLNVPELVGREHDSSEEVDAYSSLVDARGWPCLSLWGGIKIPKPGGYINGAPVSPIPREHWIVPLSVKSPPVGFTDYRLLPLRPIWPGFAINTVFYALVLWLLFAAPFALRQRRRIKRGLCPKCAYDLRGTSGSVCPECGATK